MDHDVIIVGGGIGGSAAALRAAQYNLRVAWLRGDKTTAKRSRSQWVGNIDNMIGIHDGMVRKKILKLLRGNTAAQQAIEAKPHLHISTRDIVSNTAQRIEESHAERVQMFAEVAEHAAFANGRFEVRTATRALEAPALLLATGVMDRQPSIKRTRGDETLDAPRWIYPFANRETVLYCIRCEGHLTAGRRVAVIGHGEAAAQLAMMLHERYGSGCAVLTNGEALQAAPRSLELLAAYGITVHQQRIVDAEGKAGKLHRLSLEGGESVEVQFALVSLGLHRVYNELARELGAALEDGEAPIEQRHVLVDKRGETSLRGLFAVGDMARRSEEGMMKQIYTAQEYAVRAVDAIDGRRRAAMRAEALGER